MRLVPPLSTLLSQKAFPADAAQTSQRSTTSAKPHLAHPGPSATLVPIGGLSKRGMDLAIASVAIVLLSPLMIMVAVLIKLTTGGPVIFAHRRIGCGGQSFHCFKFCTMVRDGDAALAQHLAKDPQAAQEWQETHKLRWDPRVTPLGAALRAYSIDELPQLFNVLQGTMSCVGPRPVVQIELERYGAEAAEYVKARPGLTGLWQVSGRSTLDYADRVALDVRYVRTWTLWVDVAILMRTVSAVLRTDQTA